MKYERPEITLSADAAEIVQGSKPGGFMDSRDPQNPIHSTGAYESDDNRFAGATDLSSSRHFNSASFGIMLSGKLSPPSTGFVVF